MSTRHLRRAAAIAAGGLTALAGGACATGSDAAGSGVVEVVAAFYPLEFVADRVGGAHTSVIGLAPPGVEAHDVELTPSQVADVTRADLVVYLAGFQPAVDEAIAEYAPEAGFDVTGAVPLLGAGESGHGGADPHVWLDPDRLATIADELAAALADLDADHAAGYTANAAALGDELAALDRDYRAGLASCERREIVVSHAAFGYLADRYDLTQIAITGLSPEQEPTPRRLNDVIQAAREHGATTIFFEVLVSPDVAEVIAGEVGATTAVLDPIEGLAPDSRDDYLSLMRNNLDALRAALGCT